MEFEGTRKSDSRDDGDFNRVVAEARTLRNGSLISNLIGTVALMARKRATLTGSHLRPRTTEDKAAIVAALRETVCPLYESGRIRLLIHAIYPLEQVAAAHREMAEGAHIGKIVLAVQPAALTYTISAVSYGDHATGCTDFEDTQELDPQLSLKLAPTTVG
jgi:hypothetical protein